MTIMGPVLLDGEGGVVVVLMDDEEDDGVEGEVRCWDYECDVDRD